MPIRLDSPFQVGQVWPMRSGLLGPSLATGVLDLFYTLESSGQL